MSVIVTQKKHLTKMDNYKKMCDTNKNVTQMGVCDRKRGLIVIFHMN